jgi:hypothetical protein
LNCSVQVQPVELCLNRDLGFDTTYSHANKNFTLTENEGNTLDGLDQC